MMYAYSQLCITAGKEMLHRIIPTRYLLHDRITIVDAYYITNSVMRSKN